MSAMRGVCMADDVLLNKAAIIERCVARAREEYEVDRATFAASFSRQDAAILNIQRACEAALDMGHHVIRRATLGLPPLLRRDNNSSRRGGSCRSRGGSSSGRRGRGKGAIWPLLRRENSYRRRSWRQGSTWFGRGGLLRWGREGLWCPRRRHGLRGAF